MPLRYINSRLTPSQRVLFSVHLAQPKLNVVFLARPHGMKATTIQKPVNLSAAIVLGGVNYVSSPNLQIAVTKRTGLR
jgi:hypothetical protein